MAPVELHLLGTFRVLVAGDERAIAARKQRALIAALALRPQARPREKVIAELWPESDDERGRQSLRHALHEIKSAVGAELIVSAHDSLRLADDAIVDVRELEAGVASGRDDGLERALDIYQGDLCPEVEGVDGEGERARLRGLFAAAGETLAARRLAGDPAASVAIARRVIEIDPYREEAHRLLLRAIAASGDLAGAAVHYRRLTSLLRDELGVEPSADTKQLYASLGKALVLRMGPRPSRPSLEPPKELIGRRAEYGRLMGLVTDAIDGRGASALVVGEPGAGKSRLLEEIVAVSERHGLRVLRARATAAEGALPFQLWVDALAPASAEAAALADPWPAVLATLLPEAAYERPGVVAPELRRTRLFEAVTRLLGRVAAGSPALLVLDDLHHADPDSVQLFHYVARTSRQRRLAVIAASRPPTVAGDLAEARASLEALGELGVVSLGPLSEDGVTQLLLSFGVSREDAAWLSPRVAVWTAGNPFFVLEVLRALVGQGRLLRNEEAWTWSGMRPADDAPLSPDLPSTVLQTILSRSGALPEATRRALDLVAVLGPRTRLELIASVGGRDELAVADDLGPALDAGLLREVREGPLAALAFTHELVRDATYQRIPMTVRAAIHRRAAAALERSGATSHAIAFHLTAGGDATRAADQWIASAREAEQRFAHDDAIHSYRCALQAFGSASPRRAEILMAIGDSQMRRGSAPEGVGAYEDALSALPADAAEQRAALATRIAGAARYYHRHPRALEHALAAVEHYRGGDPVHLAEALVSLAWVRYVDGDAKAAQATADEAGPIAGSAGAARVEAGAIRLAVWARWLGGESIAGPDPREIERLAKALGDDEEVAMLLVASATSLHRRGLLHEATGPARRGLEIARRVGSLRAELEAGEELASLLRMSGAFREGIEIADEVRADSASLQFDEPPRVLGELVQSLAAVGDEDRAVQLASELIAARAAIGRPIHNSPALDSASGLMTLGRPPDRDVIERERPTCATCQIGWQMVAARHAALTGDPERAVALADAFDAATSGGRYPAFAGWAASLHARAYALAGPGDEVERAAAAARAGFRSVGNAYGETLLDRDLARISAVHA